MAFETKTIWKKIIAIEKTIIINNLFTEYHIYYSSLKNSPIKIHSGIKLQLPFGNVFPNTKIMTEFCRESNIL